MPLDFNSVYHTETMVKILREQGSTQLAMELAELILQRQPDHAGVRAILAELKEEARLAFERFKNSGRVAADSAPLRPEETIDFPVAEKAALEEPTSLVKEIAAPVEEDEAIEVEPVPYLTLVSNPTVSSNSRERKIERLQGLLRRLEINQRLADASAT